MAAGARRRSGGQAATPRTGMGRAPGARGGRRVDDDGDPRGLERQGEAGLALATSVGQLASGLSPRAGGPDAGGDREASCVPATMNHETDELLLRIRGLVRVREILRDRGASDEELEAHSAEIGRLQWRLAEYVRRSVSEAR